MVASLKGILKESPIWLASLPWKSSQNEKRIRVHCDSDDRTSVCTCCVVVDGSFFYGIRA